jgi:hypothetical protein
MPKAKLVSTHGLNFEDAMKRLIATPPPKASSKVKQASKPKNPVPLPGTRRTFRAPFTASKLKIKKHRFCNRCFLNGQG